MEWIEGTPRYGDIIRTKVTFYHHYGIFVDQQRVIQFGLPDDPGKPAELIKVIATDIYTFLQGGDLEVGKPNADEKKRLRAPAERVHAAEQRIGTGGYDILHNNCEHFVNECAFGEKNSSFVDNVRAKLRQKLGKN